ncbi:MAG: MgtC/SapB family protein [Rhodoplanes sp.]
MNEANMEELLRTTTFTPGDLSLRLAVPGLCGIVLGIDREIRGFAAGIRTHALVSLSSAVITISALMLYHEIRESGDGAPDPAGHPRARSSCRIYWGWRLFIARGSVKNLTTAANIWLSAALGIASGAGQFLLVLLGTGFGAFIVTLVWLLERFVSADSPLEQVSSDDDRRGTNHSAE